MSSSKKNWPVKGLCGRCLSDLWTGDAGSHVGILTIFDPALWTIAPLAFSLVHLSLPLPSLNKYTVYTYTVCKGGWYGVIRGEWASDRLSPFTGLIKELVLPQRYFSPFTLCKTSYRCRVGNPDSDGSALFLEAGSWSGSALEQKGGSGSALKALCHNSKALETQNRAVEGRGRA